VQTLLDVHVGSQTPAQWNERERLQAGRNPARRAVRPRIAAEAIDWEDLGLQPRWVGDDTSEAVAAIEPSNHSGEGADEWRRFQAGARARGELELYVSTCAPPDDEPRPSIFPRSARIYFPYLLLEDFHIHADPIRLARPPELAEGLSATDKDLALRIRNERGTDREWLAFEPKAHQYDGGRAFERRQGRFFGTWTSLLVTPDGRTVVGVWSDGGTLDSPVRHYVLPDMDSYRPILQWLVERAVPDFVPTAAARTRQHIDTQPELQTDRERALTGELAELTAGYELAKSELEAQLALARTVASPVRDAMLFGTGHALETAVARVLSDAGLGVEALDETLGTASGDLLVEHANERILVEVKSCGGPAAERLVDALLRHCQTWPQLRPDQPLTGAALIVNHQHKQPPADRPMAVYQRGAFVDSLEHPVVSTLELFDAWRRQDWAAIRESVGVERPATTTAAQATTAPATEGGGRRSWWERAARRR